jgi:hypothetical protein
MPTDDSQRDLTPRKGMPSPRLSRDAFRRRYLRQFVDPAFARVRDAIDAVEAVAWDAYEASRKAPVTGKAGPHFADPDYDMSVDSRRVTPSRRRAGATRILRPARASSS